MGNHPQGPNAQGDGRQNGVLPMQAVELAKIVELPQVPRHGQARPGGEYKAKNPTDENGAEEARHRHARGGQEYDGTIREGALANRCKQT